MSLHGRLADPTFCPVNGQPGADDGEEVVSRARARPADHQHDVSSTLVMQ
jgi:hypothetical protein